MYRPNGLYKDIYVYDVNSLYPYASLNPMPGTECIYIESFEEQGLDLDNLFGFFFAKVITNEQYLGLLPLHINNNLIFPSGEYSGIWSSEELKFARKNGYKIKVIKGYNFNKIENTFKNFVLYLFNKKANSILILIFYKK